MEQLSEFIINHWILVTAFSAALGLLIANLMSAAGGVSVQEAVALINRDNAVVVDIRPAAEFEQGHIIEAINIPQSELDDGLKKLRKHESQPILVCCSTGTSSGAAVRTLRTTGFDGAKSIKGGISSWRQENLPLTN
ncbi:MAG: rhodanese-like domain-containing protein [Gammaproteobacteria bacterium]